VLLTRSPLWHHPERWASLDLHVLSTPPAFVLSQDQTLRECYITTTGHQQTATRDVDTESTTTTVMTEPGPNELAKQKTHYLNLYLQTTHTPQPTKARMRKTIHMALTFGTLLSSQRTDTHHHNPPRPIRGNLRNTTRPQPPRQTQQPTGNPITIQHVKKRLFGETGGWSGACVRLCGLP
jgi:hypothetical protein